MSVTAFGSNNSQNAMVVVLFLSDESISTSIVPPKHLVEVLGLGLPILAHVFGLDAFVPASHGLVLAIDDALAHVLGLLRATCRAGDGAEDQPLRLGQAVAPRALRTQCSCP